ncbi:putative TetR family transcriptional regulator [Gordonia effusa NBRC 100432]|uniref:Putative TetR family transcriptional regulator n=1 Tax=Gordonia effusa NBRC 100432 TaxID=1077974 RepID=H0R5U9_9ACTN|nr:TetR/AcrR family transcriptional regulator [Gordonia effusa]GAB20450.1 putative TetR family transcriptional regulator [Gordonia effusa NBRC 100432]
MTVGRRARSPRGSGEQLRGEIITAAMELLTEHGSPEAVSVRAVAARVGVTPPSIYLHFADKDQLLDAVTAASFQQLDDVLATAGEGIDDPLERALAEGMAYVRFAVANPVLYELAFAQPATFDNGSMVDEVLATAAFLRLSRTVQALIDEGFYPPGDVVASALELWSASHGVASLMISKPHLPWGDDLTLAENVLRAVCFGRASIAILGDRPGHDDARAALDALRDVARMTLDEPK